MIRKEGLIGRFISSIENFYDFNELIGEGVFGKVYKVENKLTNDLYACKIISKESSSNLIKLKNELSILRSLDHPNVIKLYEIYEDQENLYLIFEDCNGGEVFNHIESRLSSKEFFNEQEAASLFRQIISALSYIHAQGIVHRDLKPENLMFNEEYLPESGSLIKLIDFGLSKKHKEGDFLKSKVGSSLYMAPEVLTGKYTSKADLWSAGVILYVLLSGNFPFYSNNEAEYYRLVKTGKFQLSGGAWNKISKEAKDLLIKLLIAENSRLSAAEVLEHPWMQNKSQVKIEITTEDFSNIMEYTKLNKMSKAVISFIAYRLKDSDIRNMIEEFKSLDINNDGVLSYKEMQLGFKNFSLTNKSVINPDELESIFKEIDLDHNNMINYTEFIAAILNHKNSLSEQSIQEAFRNFDTDQNGTLSFNEICHVIRPSNNDEIKEFQEMIKKMDTDGDGTIDYDEFKNALNSI